MNLQEDDVVWWNAPEFLGKEGVYKICHTPTNQWDFVVLESKDGFYTVANISELEKLNLPWP